MPKRSEIAPGIFFTPHADIEFEDLANYIDEINTMVKISKSAYDENTVESFMCFGMAGTGKTSLVRRAIWSLNDSYKVKCSIIEIECNTLVPKASTAERAKEYLDTAIYYMRTRRPMAVIFDEFDAFALKRTVITDPRITKFCQLLLGLLNQNFAQEIRDEGQLVVVGITNDLSGIDDAVRDRLGPTIYIPLPSSLVIEEILQKQKIPEYEKVARIIIDDLSGNTISPRGLVNGCTKAMPKISRTANMPPRELAKYILGASSGIKTLKEVNEYEIGNDPFIKHSKRVLDFLG